MLFISFDKNFGRIDETGEYIRRNDWCNYRRKHIIKRETPAAISLSYLIFELITEVLYNCIMLISYLKIMTCLKKYFIPIIVGSFFLLYSCASIPVEREREADLHFKLGVSYLNESNYQMAYLHFQNAYKIEPKNKELLNSLGLIYLHFEDFEKARKFFLDAISIDRNFSIAHNNLGIVYIRISKWDEAIEHFKKALTNPLYQNPESAYFNLGSAYYRHGQYELASAAYKNSIKRAPEFAPSYYGLALCYNKTGRYGEASEMLSTAIEIDPAYNGDTLKFINEIRKQYLKSDSNAPDLADYLEIINY